MKITNTLFNTHTHTHTHTNAKKQNSYNIQDRKRGTSGFMQRGAQYDFARLRP